MYEIGYLDTNNNELIKNHKPFHINYGIVIKNTHKGLSYSKIEQRFTH